MKELIDVLDENGKNIGKIATRSEVHKQGLWHRGAVVVLIDKNGKILMQQRSKNVETFPECWDVSAAGHISAGQSSNEAAIRELSEEIGVHANINELIPLVHFKEGTIVRDDCIENLFFDCYLIEKEHIDIANIQMQASEVSQVKLCSIDEVMELVNTKKVLPRDRLYKELNSYFKNRLNNDK